uniref:G protein-coupled receptor 155 n=1 Tax=Oncorhynchus kisutch TaxID=8019 RepID=A0A8C7HZ56_ONCKI
MDVPAISNNLNLSNGDLDPSDTPPTMSIDKLFPALLECFGIILCGYIAGRANIITSTQAKGLGNFVSKFALPALLFKNMVLLDFGNVIWPFLWSILIAKVSVFFIVCVITLLVASPDTRFSKAGLFSIFATQSNDFALGYPIVEALYKNTHPEYLQYIYLVAPVSLMLLNPIGFAFCEIQKWRDQRDRQQSKLQIVGVVILQVLKNPMVFMVVIGIIFHFILDQKIPAFMEQFVDGLANSFGGAALFYLGLSMVGQLGKLTRSTVVALILLITAKLLVMPLICRETVELLDADNTSSSLEHSSLSNYAFLYGVFPSAPSVAIYAAHYNMELQVVTSGMVISTFLSAPIMYVSAWLLTIPWMDPKPLMDSLQNVSFNVSIISLVALAWTVTVMFLSKKFKRLPHMFTVNLFLAQILACVSMIMWNFVVRQDRFIGHVLTFTLLYGSLYSTYVWPGLIALSLVLMKRGGELKVAPGFLVIAGWGVPALVAAVLLVTGERMPDTIDSAFFYGRPQCDNPCFNLSPLRVPGRLYLELQFFCAVVNYGQGFISFGLFGLDKHLIILPFKKKISCLWHRRKPEEQPQLVVSDDIMMTCTQFIRYHKEQCVRDIVQQKRCGERTVADTFLGSELVEWLLQVGLSQDRGEALLYGIRLQQGGVLQHITQEYGFKDDNLHYCIENASLQWASRVVQSSNALHHSARGVTTDPGSIITGCDRESHRVAHNWPSVVRVWPGGLQVGRHCK